MKKEEEMDILESYEKGEWQSVANLKEEIARYQLYAKETLAQMEKITIPISAEDLHSIQEKADEAGISYQALVAQIVREYANGRLIQKPLAQ
ncbi:MAG: antitoxin [Anaerolineaceae bacterium]|nr:antitoxin [Anaerolineaceae bacterium]